MELRTKWGGEGSSTYQKAAVTGQKLEGKWERTYSYFQNAQKLNRICC